MRQNKWVRVKLLLIGQGIFKKYSDVIEAVIIVTTLLIFINILSWQDGTCTPKFSYGKVTGISLTKGK